MVDSMVPLMDDRTAEQWDYLMVDLMAETWVALKAVALVDPSALHWADYLVFQIVV